jgi:hypothetical protein
MGVIVEETSAPIDPEVPAETIPTVDKKRKQEQESDPTVSNARSPRAEKVLEAIKKLKRRKK